jgi:hypothetical protein
MSAIASLCSIERKSRVPCIQGVTHEAEAVVRDEGIIGFPEGQTKRRPKEESCPTDRRDTESQIEQGMTLSYNMIQCFLVLFTLDPVIVDLHHSLCYPIFFMVQRSPSGGTGGR